MADVVNTIDGKLVLLYISTNVDTPSYKSVVCKIDGGVSTSADVNTVATSCGVAKARGDANNTVSGSLAANTAPGGTEMSSEELFLLGQSGDDFLWKYADDPTTPTIYRAGTGFLSSYNETYNFGDVVKADFTIEVKGDIDSTP